MKPILPFQIHIVGNRDQLERTMDIIQYVISEHGVEESQADIIAMSVGEACQNAVRYSYASHDDAQFDLKISIEAGDFTATVVNTGEEFEFDRLEQFNQEQDFQMYSSGGLGIPMMKKLMDEVTYQRESDDRNVVVLKKKIQPDLTSREGGGNED